MTKRCRVSHTLNRSQVGSGHADSQAAIHRTHLVRVASWRAGLDLPSRLLLPVPEACGIQGALADLLDNTRFHGATGEGARNVEIAVDCEPEFLVRVDACLLVCLAELRHPAAQAR
jgi:hypothetical protein